MRNFMLAATLLILSAGAGNAFAGELNEQNGVAIKGYDPVSYVIDGKAEKGLEKFSAPHRGVSFRFVSAAHRDAFLAAPDKYAPQYGGFCAYGTAQGYKADIDPQAFTVIDGKLYLNYNQAVVGEWRKDTAGHIKKADAEWPAVAKQEKVHR